eukprot:675615-Prymnesium_polylepis.1
MAASAAMRCVGVRTAALGASASRGSRLGRFDILPPAGLQEPVEGSPLLRVCRLRSDPAQLPQVDAQIADESVDVVHRRFLVQRNPWSEPVLVLPERAARHEARSPSSSRRFEVCVALIEDGWAVGGA